MKGIEILTMTEIREYPEICSKLAPVIAILFLVGVIFVITDHDVDLLTVIGAIMVLISIIGLVILVNKYPERSTGRYKYEAVIDEDVDIQDVYEKYKVIEKDGKKWILEDKED